MKIHLQHKDRNNIGKINTSFRLIYNRERLKDGI